MYVHENTIAVETKVEDLNKSCFDALDRRMGKTIKKKLSIISNRKAAHHLASSDTFTLYFRAKPKERTEVERSGGLRFP